MAISFMRYVLINLSWIPTWTQACFYRFLMCGFRLQKWYWAWKNKITQYARKPWENSLHLSMNSAAEKVSRFSHNVSFPVCCILVLFDGPTEKRKWIGAVHCGCLLGNKGRNFFIMRCSLGGSIYRERWQFYSILVLKVSLPCLNKRWTRLHFCW